MNHNSDSCIIFFVKYPAAGRVKTRLAQQIGQHEAAQLYKNFVTDLLGALRDLNENLKIFFDPPDAESRFQQWLGEEYSYVPQSGQGLGQKMKNAFLYTFESGFKHAVIIGSGSPDLPMDFVDSALSALDTNDAAIGPSSDGGYYLIAFSKTGFVPEVFDDISWNSDSVFEQTVNILQRYGANVRLLPQWYDVDTLADLKTFLRRNKNTEFDKSATYSYLLKNELGGQI